MEIKKENVLKEKEELKKSFYDLANSTEKSPDVLIKECKKLEDKAKKLSDTKLLYEILYQEAELYKKMNNFPQALYHYTLSLQHVTDSEHELLANLHHKIGIIHWYMGRYDNALEHFHKNLAYWTDLNNDKSIANALSNIGTIYNRTERFDEALKYFQQALEIRKKINDKKGIAIALNNIGIAYENQKDLEKALSYHTQSLKIKADLQDEEGSGITLFNIGEIYYEKKDLDNALEFVRRALKIFSTNNEVWKIVYCHHLLGKILVEKESYLEAENEFLKAKKQAEKIKADDLRKMIYQSLSEFYQKQKKYKKALHYYQLFTEAKDKIFNENSAKKMMMLEHKLEVERAEKEAEIYRLKNIELAKANELVKVANQQLTETNERLQNEIDQRNKAEIKIHSHQEHLQLINTILRHDLTNNLAVIKSAVKIFHQTNDNNLLHNIDNYVNKSVSLIKKMREMEKLITENKNLHSYQVSKIIHQITKNFQGVSISLHGDAYIFADDTIFSIFDNLIGNAVKHADSDTIEVKVIRQKNYVEIRIIDYGIGIPEQIFDKIFEKDFTYGKSAGSGLGLHIVKKAMESISGGVFVEKNEPRGTVFVLLFRGVDI